MGKGQIISSLGSGEYVIQCLYNRIRIDKMVATLGEQIIAAESMIADYDSEMMALNSDLSDINAEIWQSEVDKSALDAALSILNGELADLQAILEGYQAEASALQDQIDSANNSIAGLNDQIDEAEGEIDQLEVQAAALQAEIDSMEPGPEQDAKQSELDAVNQEISELNNTIDQYQSAIATLNNQIDLWETEIDQIEINDIAPQETEVTDKQKEVEAKQSEIDAKKMEIDAAGVEKTGKLNEIAKHQAMIDGKNLYITGLEKRREMLLALPEDPVVGAWCVDLTDDLSGEVGTIEPYGEYDYNRTLIRPGYDCRHIWEAGRDGQLQFVKGMTPAQAYYNLAMLPGWQCWMPVYRIGEITAINRDENTCSLTVETARSSQQQIVVSGWPSLENVTIEYMSCNHAAFAVGDRVVIEYRNRSAGGEETPVVIGFESEPKPCEWEGWNGPDLDSAHPWVKYVDPVPSNYPWTIELLTPEQSVLRHDYTAPLGIPSAFTLLWIPSIPEAQRPVLGDGTKLYFNISSTITQGNDPYFISYALLFMMDESSRRKSFYFARTAVFTMPAFNNPVWIGDNDGTEPIDVSPLSGRITTIQYEAVLGPGARLVYESDFIKFQ